MNETIKNIRELISKGEIEKALGILKEELEDSDFFDIILLLELF